MPAEKNNEVRPPERPEVCPACGSRRLRRRPEAEQFTYGEEADAVALTAVVYVESCDDCFYEFFAAPAEDARHEAICAHLRVMPPNNIRQIRQLHSDSRKEFAEISGLGSATLGRWERGAGIQNTANDRYLYLLGFEDNLHRLHYYISKRAHTETSAETSTRFPHIPDIESARADAAAFSLV